VQITDCEIHCNIKAETLGTPTKHSTLVVLKDHQLPSFPLETSSGTPAFPITASLPANLPRGTGTVCRRESFLLAINASAIVLHLRRLLFLFRASPNESSFLTAKLMLLRASNVRSEILRKERQSLRFADYIVCKRKRADELVREMRCEIRESRKRG